MDSSYQKEKKHRSVQIKEYAESDNHRGPCQSEDCETSECQNISFYLLYAILSRDLSTFW